MAAFFSHMDTPKYVYLCFYGSTVKLTLLLIKNGAMIIHLQKWLFKFLIIFLDNPREGITS